MREKEFRELESFDHRRKVVLFRKTGKPRKRRRRRRFRREDKELCHMQLESLGRDPGKRVLEGMMTL